MQAGAVNIKLMADITDMHKKMTQAEKLVGGTVDGIGKQFKALALSVGAGLSIGAFAGWIKGAIAAADESAKMAQQIGVSTSQVAGLQLAFRQSGVEATQMVPIMAKLGVAIAGGSKAFDAMGISGKAQDGTLKSTRDVLGEVADKFAGYENGAAKTALAVGLLGEEGAKLLPLLSAGSAGLDDYDAMALKLGLTISETTGKNAEKFNDTLDLMSQAGQGVGRQIAAQLLPTLSGLADQFFTSMSSGDRLQKTAEFLGSALKVLYIAGLGVVEVFTTVGTVLGGTAAMIVAALSGDFAGAAAIFNSLVTDVGNGWSDTAKQMTDAWNATGSASFEAMATMQKAGKGAAPVLADIEKQTKATTEAEKKAAKALEDMHKAGDAAAKARQDIVNKERDGINDWMIAQTEAYAAAVKGSKDAVIAAQAEVEQYGMTASQIAEITLLTMESSRAKFHDGAAGLEALEKQIAAQKELIGWMRGKEVLDASKKVNDTQVAEQKKTVEQIDDIFRTGFAGMINSGVDGWAAFTKSLATTFKTTVADAIYKTFAQPFVVKMVASVLGITGSGAASAGQSGGMDGLSNLSSMASTGMGWLTDFGGSTAGAVSSMGANIGGEVGANMIMNSEAIGATAQSLGTVLGYAQAAYAFSQGNYGEAAGRAAGTFFFGPIGGELGGKLGSLLDGGGKISARDTGDASLTTGANGQAILMDTINGLSAQTAGIAVGLQSSYANAARALGIDMAQTNFHIRSNSGRQGANPNLVFGSSVNGNRVDSGELSAADSPAVALAASRAVFNALQSSTLPEYLSGAFDGLTASTATQEQITSALAGAQALATFHVALTALPFDRVASLSYEATQGLIAASGGLDALATNLATYYTNFFSDEEQRAQKIININAATSGSGLDAATATRATFRALVESQDLTTASGQQTYAALLAVSGAFAELVPAATIAGAAVIEVVKLSETLIRLNETTAGLRIELLAAQGDTQGAADALRTLNTFGFSASEIAAYDLNDSLRESISTTNALAQAEKDASAAAIAEAQRIASERASLDQMLMQALGDTAGLRALELSRLDESNRSIQQRIWAIQDEAVAAQAATLAADELARAAAVVADALARTATDAAAAAEAIVRANKNWQDQLDVLTGATTQRAQSLANDLAAATDDSTRSLIAQVYAQQDLNAAAEATATALAQAAETAATAIAQIAVANKNWQDQLDVLTGATTQRAQDLANALSSATDDSTRSLIEQVYAQQDLATAAEAAATAATASAAAQQQAASDTLAAAQTAVSDAMAAVGRAVDAERTRITDIYETQADAINASLSTVGDSISKLESLAGTLKSTLDGMRVSGSDSAYRSAAQAQISAALVQARSGGGLPLDGQLDSALRTVAQPSEQLFGSFEDYARDFYKTANDISSLADLTEVALTADQVQQRQMRDGLAALERYHTADMARLDSIISTAQAQVDAANGINQSVLSVSAALAELGTSISNLASAQTAAQQQAAQQQAAQQQAAAKAAASVTPAVPAGVNLTTPASPVPSLPTTAPGQDTVPYAMWQGYMRDAGADLAGAAYDSIKQAAWNASGLSGVPSFAVGVNNVPYDMTANIHAGERIIPAADNRELMTRLASPQSNNAALVSALRDMTADRDGIREEIKGLRADITLQNRQIAVSTKNTADILQKFDIVGLPAERTPA